MRRCDTCRKLEKIGKTKRCRVLTELVGLDRDCFAWTDNPDWEAEVEEATRRYAERKGEWDEWCASTPLVYSKRSGSATTASTGTKGGSI